MPNPNPSPDPDPNPDHSPNPNPNPDPDPDLDSDPLSQEDQQRTAKRNSGTDVDESRKPETRLDLWRGMRDTEVTDTFMQHGGTECVIGDRIQRPYSTASIKCSASSVRHQVFSVTSVIRGDPSPASLGN